MYDKYKVSSTSRQIVSNLIRHVDVTMERGDKVVNLILLADANVFLKY